MNKKRVLYSILGCFTCVSAIICLYVYMDSRTYKHMWNMYKEVSDAYIFLPNQASLLGRDYYNYAGESRELENKVETAFAELKQELADEYQTILYKPEFYEIEGIEVEGKVYSCSPALWKQLQIEYEEGTGFNDDCHTFLAVNNTARQGSYVTVEEGEKKEEVFTI